MSIMKKKLLQVLPTLLFILFNQPSFAIELQSAPEAEKMTTCCFGGGDNQGLCGRRVITEALIDAA